MDSGGEQMGVVTEVDTEEQVADVEPDPGLAESIIQGYGFGSADEDDIEVTAASVET